MNRSEIRSKAFRDSLLVVASGLDQENIVQVLFLHKDKIKQQCTCISPLNGAECMTCPHHSGSGSKGVLIMGQLVERGVFSEENTDPLLDMLNHIGRVDLATKFSESYVQKYFMVESDPIRPGLDIGRVSPIQRPATIHSPPTQLINLGQVPTVQHDVEIDFAAHNTPLTPSHMHHVTPTHTPSPCNTPSHLSHKFGPSSPISKPVKNNCTSEYGSPEAERDLGQASDSPMVTTPPDTCCMCGQQYPANTLEANSVMLSVNSTQSLPVNASSLRNQMERFCESERAQYADAEVRHLDELNNGSSMEMSPSESPSDSPSQEFVVVLNEKELKKVNQVFQQNTLIPNKLSQKFKNPRPKQEQDDLSDSFDLINLDEFPRVCCHCQCQQNQRPSRAFSFDSIKKLTPKNKKKFFPHQTSVPEVSQSCSNIPDCNSTGLAGSRHCTCDGACNHSPAPAQPSRETRRGWMGSKDSGMGCSQESANSTENLKGSEGSGKTCPLSPQAKHSEDGIGLCDWKIDRSKCHTAIYNHKNIFFNKRVNTYIGKGKSKQSVNLLVKLYPDGLDGDRGSSATLTVDVIGMSHCKANYVVECTFRGIDTQSNSLLVSRKTEFPISPELKSHTVNGFLSHNIIKQSSAKYFKFYLKFQLRVVMDREWVVVGDSPSH